MWPYLGSVKVYILCYFAGILAHFILALIFARRFRLTWPVAMLASACYFVGMTVGAKALFDLRRGDFSPAHLLSLPHYLQGGLWGGPLAYLGLAVPLVLLVTKERRAALDLIALSLPVPMLLAKIACLCNGCCYGRPTSLPWAICFPAGRGKAPSGVPLHPTQIYEMLVLGLAALVVYRMNRPQWRGTLLFGFLAIYGIGRPLTEFFRGGHDDQPLWGPFTPSQWLCATASAASICILCRHGFGLRRKPSSLAEPSELLH